MVLLSLIMLGLVFYYFSDVVTYVLISWILAMLGQPIMNFFRNKLRFSRFRFGEVLGAVITLLVFITVFAFLFVLFVPLILQQANNFTHIDYHQIYVSLQDPIQAFNDRLLEWGLSEGEGIGPDTFRDSFSRYFNISGLGSMVSSIFSFAGSFMIGVFSVLFITFFFLQDNTLFTNFITALVPNQFEDQTRQVIQDISSLLRRYFTGILLQISIITTIVTIGLALLGIQNALLIGFFAAIINVIPYIGPLIGALFGIILTISSNLDLDFYTQMLPKILKVAAVFAGMQMIDNFVLQPFIYGTSAKAHPLEIFIVILLAAKIGGIPGMIIAIPSYIVIRVIARAFLFRFKIVQRLTGGM